MGAYSPSTLITNKIEKKINKKIIEPTLKAMRKKGSPYRGILYAGLMIDDQEIKVLEYNCRFGDPETQPILMRMNQKYYIQDFIMQENL